jgi:hypothetical protein
MTKRQLEKWHEEQKIIRAARKIESDIMHSYIREDKSQRQRFFSK